MRYATFYPLSKRNETPVIPYKNPDPPNAMSMDTGNAGLDGYSTLSRANRFNGERPEIGGEPDYPFPNNTTED
jgi:hypothetical protein